MTKPTKWHLCPAKTQISLGIRPVWSESSLCTQWVAKDPSFLHADSEDSDQTGWMPRLTWVFAGRTCYFVSFVMRRLICISLFLNHILVILKSPNFQIFKATYFLWIFFHRELDMAKTSCRWNKKSLTVCSSGYLMIFERWVSSVLHKNICCGYSLESPRHVVGTH